MRPTLNDAQVEALRRLAGDSRPTIVSVHAYEDLGVNAIPEAFADELAQRLGWPADDAIVQTNLVAHTGADGYGRLARQPAFDGTVHPGTDYVLVDDFVGMGGTLANLRGYIESKGGRVLGALALTGKQYSAKLTLEEKTLEELRQTHGQDLIGGGKTGSVTPSTALLNQKLGTSPAPRMLTPSEIELLRQSKREIAARRVARAG
ncbi:MAG: phosphoribosyltransferase [Gammaproteobacteria bacterium]